MMRALLVHAAASALVAAVVYSRMRAERERGYRDGYSDGHLDSRLRAFATPQVSGDNVVPVRWVDWAAAT